MSGAPWGLKEIVFVDLGNIELVKAEEFIIRRWRRNNVYCDGIKLYYGDCKLHAIAVAERKFLILVKIIVECPYNIVYVEELP